MTQLRAVLLAGALGLTACQRTPSGVVQRSLPPPTPAMRAATRVLPVPGAASELEVSVAISNPTKVSFRIAAGPDCPYVLVFPDATGEPRGSLSGSMSCSFARVVDLAPGDSTVLVRVLPADTLARYAPGTYGVNVAVTTTTVLTGMWAGAIQLPLPRAP